MDICNRFIYGMFRDWNRIPIHIFFGFVFWFNDYDRFELDNVVKWWKKLATKRYNNISKDGRLRNELEVFNKVQPFWRNHAFVGAIAVK